MPLSLSSTFVAALLLLVPPLAPHAAEPPTARAELYANPAVRDEPWHAGWADAVVSGDLVVLSGVVAGLRDDEGPADAENAMARAFERIENLLAQAGAEWKDVIEITAYLTDVDRQTPALNKVRLRYMEPPYAASTVVQVSRLIPDRGIAEIRVLAHRTPREPASSATAAMPVETVRAPAP